MSARLASGGPARVSPATRVQYVLGAAIVLGFLIGLVVYVTDQARTLADHLGTGPIAVASYPATAVSAYRPGHPAQTYIVLHSSFSESTYEGDECFSSKCIDYVPVSPAATQLLHYPQAVTISAGHGRILKISAGSTVIDTHDAPPGGIALYAARLVGGGWGLLFVTLLAIAYFFLGIDIRIWRLHPVQWVRSFGWIRIVSALGSLAVWIGFVSGRSFGLGLAGVGLTVMAAASHLARRHLMPIHDNDDPVVMRHRNVVARALYQAMYVAVAIPVPIGINVALLQYSNHHNIAALVIAPIAGVVLAAIFVYLLHRRLERPSLSRATL